MAKSILSHDTLQFYESNNNEVGSIHHNPNTNKFEIDRSLYLKDGATFIIGSGVFSWDSNKVKLSQTLEMDSGKDIQLDRFGQLKIGNASEDAQGRQRGYWIDTEDGRLYSRGNGTVNKVRIENQMAALSIWADRGIGTGSKFYHTSDERIKTNIRDISDNEALETFRKLQPKIYNYKDPIKAGYNSVYGFLAQEVEEVIPESTTKDTGFIPNIYSICEINNSTNTLTFHFDTSGDTIDQFDLSVNDVIQIEDVCKNMIERTIVDIIDDYSIQLNGGYIPPHTHDSSGVQLPYNEVFVYGKKVDDLYRLGKDAIWTVAAAALQEVDKQLVAEKEKVATLENQMSELMARVAVLENSN